MSLVFYLKNKIRETEMSKKEGGQQERRPIQVLYWAGTIENDYLVLWNYVQISCINFILGDLSGGRLYPSALVLYWSNSLHKVLTPSHSWPAQIRGPSETHPSMSVRKSWGEGRTGEQVRCPWAQLTLRCKNLHSSSCRQWSDTVHKNCLIQYVPPLTVQMQSRGRMSH